MPRLFNKFFKINTSEKQARETLEELFKKRGRGVPVVRELKLLFTPYYFFEYSIVSEKGEDKKVVSDYSIARGCLDQEKKELVEFECHDSELVNEFNEITPFEAVQPRINSRDARKIATFLLSKEKKCPRECIDFLHFNLYFVPVWRFKTECEKEFFDFEVNAHTGEVDEITPLKVKHGPWGAAVSETLTDLKKPRNWLTYVAAVIRGFFTALRKIFLNRYVKGFFGALWRNKDLQLLVLLAILAVALYAAFGQGG